MTINNLTPGFHLSVLFFMIKFCQNNNKKMSKSRWFRILWQSYGVKISSIKCQSKKKTKTRTKTNCAQKAGTHEIKGLTKASICSIIAQTVLCSTDIYLIILDGWNIQHALITHIFLSIAWSPSYGRWRVAINLAI